MVSDNEERSIKEHLSDQDKALQAIMAKQEEFGSILHAVQVNQRDQVSRTDQLRREVNSFANWKETVSNTIAWALSRQAQEDRVKRWIDWLIRTVIVAAVGAFFYHLLAGPK